MAAIDESGILYVPGTLIANPANSTGPAYGGTILGSGRKFRVLSNLNYVQNYAVEFARTNRVFVINGNVTVLFNLRQWNDDGKNDFFPGASGGIPAIPGTAGDGTELSGKSYVWAADRAADPSVLITNAIPRIEANMKAMIFSEEDELNVWISLLSLPSASDMLKIAPMTVLFP